MLLRYTIWELSVLYIVVEYFKRFNFIQILVDLLII